MAAVSVVLPWSMCPIVPTLTCGLVLVKVSLAIALAQRLTASLVFVWRGPAHPPHTSTSPVPGGATQRPGADPWVQHAPPGLGRRPKLPLGFEPRTSSLPRTRSTD